MLFKLGNRPIEDVPPAGGYGATPERTEAAQKQVEADSKILKIGAPLQKRLAEIAKKQPPQEK